MVLHLVAGAGAQQRPTVATPGPPVSIFSLPASDSVFATIATSEERLLLLVLWRGSPRWYSTNKSSQGGGSGTTFSSTVAFDGGDGARGGRVVRTLAIDTTGLRVEISNGFPGLVPIFSRSPAIVEFLQCDAKQTDPRSVMPCALLKKK